MGRETGKCLPVAALHPIYTYWHPLRATLSLSLSVLLSNNVRVTRIVRSFFFRASRVSLVGRVKGQGDWNAITPE